MAVNLRSEKLADLFVRANEKKLLLPNFQRDFVWSLEDQRSLATSLLLDVPLGSLLLLSGLTSDFSSRAIGMKTRADLPEEAECEYLLDGQQRLSSLYSIIADPYGAPDWADRIRNSFWNLRYRWVLQVVPADEENDLFGVNNLMFSELPAEPEVVRVRLIPLRVKLDQPSVAEWHHPGWRADLGEQQRLLAVVNAAAAEGAVPLWRIAADGDTATALHVRVLQKIASDSKDKLDAQLADGEPPPRLIEALSLIRPDLEPDSGADAYRDALADLRASWVQEMTRLLAVMASFRLPVVDLPVAQVDRAIIIFESMNRGGTPLSTFDLLTARLARSDENRNLGELIFERISAFEVPVTDQLWSVLPGERPESWSPRRDSVALVKDAPSGVFKNSFLSMLSLLANLAEDRELTTAMMKQSEILAVPPAQVEAFWTQATDAILRAWAFLQIRCGVRSEGDLRNKLLVIPAALALRDDDALSNKKLLDRLEYWYWCSVLTSTYTERQNDNAIEDAKKLLRWAATGTVSENPFKARRKNVLKDPGYSDAASLLRQTEDAGVATDVGLYLLQYELSYAPYDLLSGENRIYAWSTRTEDHHLVPLGSATTVLESTQDIRRSNEGIGRLLNSPLNRSLISAEANRAIGAMPLAQYLSSVPDVARVARGVPSLDKITAEQLKGEEAASEVVVRQVMEGRFDWLSDRVTSELDSLLY